MRSITVKLVISFLAISLVSVLLILLSARYTTDLEFRRFTANNDRSNLTDTLQDYYLEHGSWEGIEHAQLFMRFGGPDGNPPHRPFNPMTVTDQGGRVLRAGSNYHLGDTVSADQIKNGTPIQVDSRTVGYLIFSQPPFDNDSPEGNFLNRINQLMIYIGLATTAIALLLG